MKDLIITVSKLISWFKLCLLTASKASYYNLHSKWEYDDAAERIEKNVLARGKIGRMSDVPSASMKQVSWNDRRLFEGED